MSLVFPRYVRGMLLSSDGVAVEGNIQGIAFSSGFTPENQRVVYESVRSGLNASDFVEDDHAYGFFPLKDDKFVLVHFQKMGKTEINSRGNVVFSEYVLIEKSQLAQLNWNLKPVIDRLPNQIEYQSIIQKDFPVLEVKDADFQSNWFDELKEHDIFVQALIIEILAHEKKISIKSAPSNSKERFSLLSSLLFVLPLPASLNISVATLGSSSGTARIFCSTSKDASLSSLDWLAPVVEEKTGSKFSAWVVNLFRSSVSFEDFLRKIKTLRIRPVKRLTGEDMDLTIDFLTWSKQAERLLISRQDELNTLADSIVKYSGLLTKEERYNWLSRIQRYAIKLSAYQVSYKSISAHLSIFEDESFRKELIEQIKDAFFVINNKSEISKLGEFVVFLGRYVSSQSVNGLLFRKFLEELVFSCFSANLDNGLLLWSCIAQLSWIQNEQWVSEGIRSLGHLEKPENLIILLEEIGLYPRKSVFSALFWALHARKSTNNLQHTYMLLNVLQTTSSSVNDISVVTDLENLLFKSFNETKNFNWLILNLKYFVSNQIIDFTVFVELLGYEKSDALFDVALSQKTDLAIYVGASIVLVFYQQMFQSGNFEKYFQCLESKYEYAVNQVAVRLSKTVDLLTDVHLTVLATFVGNLPVISDSEIEYLKYCIESEIKSRERQRKILSVSIRNIYTGAIQEYLFKIIAEFVTYQDMKAWNLLISEFNSPFKRPYYVNALILYLRAMRMDNPRNVYGFASKLRQSMPFEYGMFLLTLMPYHSLLPPMCYGEYINILRESLRADSRFAQSHIGSVIKASDIFRSNIINHMVEQMQIHKESELASLRSEILQEMNGGLGKPNANFLISVSNALGMVKSEDIYIELLSRVFYYNRRISNNFTKGSR